jgi:hypothetical protein
VVSGKQRTATVSGSVTTTIHVEPTPDHFAWGTRVERQTMAIHVEPTLDHFAWGMRVDRQTLTATLPLFDSKLK